MGQFFENWPTTQEGLPNTWSKHFEATTSSQNIFNVTSEGLEWQKAVANDKAGISLNAAETSDDQEVLVLLKSSAAVFMPAGGMLRASGGIGSENCYICLVVQTTTPGRIIISKYENGVYLNFGGTSIGLTPTASQRYWVRFRAEGTALKGRAWLEGETEPSTWQYETTNADITTGASGVFARTTGATHTISQVGVGTAGDVAPDINPAAKIIVGTQISVRPIVATSSAQLIATASLEKSGHYTLTITGSPPVLLPCANFLARLRSARRSYLQATIPYTSDVADLITARPLEDLELRFSDSAGAEHIVLTVKLDGIQITQGVQSSSIVLTGWRQSTNASPVTHSDIQAMTVSSGTFSSTMTMPGYRPEIKPADTVSANGVSFVANLVTVQGAARRNDIEVRTTMSEEATV